MSQSKCPFIGASESKTTVANWWPFKLDLRLLDRNDFSMNPLDPGFDYAEAFNTLDLQAVVKDLNFLMTDSQEWWPADYGHYGPFFVRMAWHSAGTYRIADGRGGAGSGAQRFAPLNSWPDNVNLDKARRLLWPIKQKYGLNLSWADLIVLAGTVALQSMGTKILGFAGGRVDTWSADQAYWGSEKHWLGDERYSGDRVLDDPLAAVQMGLIYVNPEGPNGVPDPLLSAVDIRETFSRMSMNDEETVALIAGGHTFGKTHGAAAPGKYVGPAPEGASIQEQGLGWKNSYGSGKARDTISSGLEGAWSNHPTSWSGDYFDNLLGYEWELTKSPAGAHQWVPQKGTYPGLVPDAHDSSMNHLPMMLTTDLALKIDPRYSVIAHRFHNNPTEFVDAFANAWYKLTHRDMGPVDRYLGCLVPKAQFIWQDLLPPKTGGLIDALDIASLKAVIMSSKLTVAQLVKTAWASAVTYRRGDKRGGANGARIRLLPQRDWFVNEPQELTYVLGIMEQIQNNFNARNDGFKSVSISDLIVLGGCAAVERASKNAGFDLVLVFTPGRTDALQVQTDIDSFAVLEPHSDGFRNYLGVFKPESAPELLVDTADQLSLSAPQMTVLIGGMRVLNANLNQSPVGVLTKQVDTLSNDFFVNLLDMSTVWLDCDLQANSEGRCRTSGALRWSASHVDLLFGSNSELRAIAEVYASKDSKFKFINDFGQAWTKVMNLGFVL